MVRTPITDSDARRSLSTFDGKGFQRPVTVDVRAFQVVSWRPGISVVNSVREQDAERHVVFRDGKLDDFVRADPLEVQRHSRVEFARIADIAFDRAVW